MSRSAADCSIIIPTRNRADILGDTLRPLCAQRQEGVEIIVVDNGSTDDTSRVVRAHEGVQFIELGANLGCAARNVGAVAARGRVLFMLDDDSWPEPGTIRRTVSLFDRRRDLGAVGCRVRLNDGTDRHDAGGVPGTFFNCGAAIRRNAFIEAGGFPIDYEYYVEEYDLSCRLLRAGWRIEPRGDLCIRHRRVSRNRDNNRMVALLVRNNFKLWQRYAPEELRQELFEQTQDRYRRIAIKENATKGFEEGLAQAEESLTDSRARRTPLSRAEFAALFGLDAAQRRLRDWADNGGITNIAIWSRGKGCEQLIDLIHSINIRVDAVYDEPVDGARWRDIPLRDREAFDPVAVDGVVVGSLSPGIAEDIAHDLELRFGEIPVISAACWLGVPLAAAAELA